MRLLKFLGNMRKQLIASGKLTFTQYAAKGKTVNIRFSGNDPNKSARADVMYIPN